MLMRTEDMLSAEEKSPLVYYGEAAERAIGIMGGALAELLGGKISVRSEKGKGSAFTVILPYEEKAA